MADQPTQHTIITQEWKQDYLKTAMEAWTVLTRKEFGTNYCSVVVSTPASYSEGTGFVSQPSDLRFLISVSQEKLR